jgi:hypothetical protein
MGISGVAPRPKPVPKATCPGCQRPVALLKSDRCLYCGASTGGAAVAAAPTSKLPAELLIALEPRASTVTTRTIWLRRVFALGGAGLLTALVMGPCMRT